MGVRGQITCQEVVEIITDYLEGVMTAEQRARVEQHLMTCDPCDGYLEQMRQTIRLMGKLTEESLDPAQKEALLAAFRGWKTSANT